MAGHYFVSITVPANTEFIDAIFTELEVTEGVLNLIEISFPDGAGGLTRCQILQNEAVIFPTNPDESYGWNDYTNKIYANLRIRSDNEVFRIKTWNRDDLYEHTINIAFSVLPVSSGAGGLLDYLRLLVFGD